MQGFSNTDGLYLHHRGVWDEILHKRLSTIESDTIANAIVASVYVDVNGLDPYSILGIFDTVFIRQISTPLVADVHEWFETTLYHYLPTYNKTYRELLLEFLGDPVRAGKYLLDGTKFATLGRRQ